jgi:surface polysaccharide O-acyltransferase-like enzyme
MLDTGATGQAGSSIVSCCNVIMAHIEGLAITQEQFASLLQIVHSMGANEGYRLVVPLLLFVTLF